MNETLVAIDQSSNLSAPAQSTTDSKPNPRPRESPRPAVEPFKLYINEPNLFWDGQAKLILKNTYTNLESARMKLFLGELEQYLTIYVDSRKTFSFEGHDYIVDVLTVGDKSAKVAISPNLLPNQAMNPSGNGGRVSE